MLHLWISVMAYKGIDIYCCNRCILSHKREAFGRIIIMAPKRSKGGGVYTQYVDADIEKNILVVSTRPGYNAGYNIWRMLLLQVQIGTKSWMVIRRL